MIESATDNRELREADMQMLDTTRVAILQSPNQPNVLPDMMLTCRLLVQSLQRLDSPERSLSSQSDAPSQVGLRHVNALHVGLLLA